MTPQEARRIVIGAVLIGALAAAVNDATKRKALPHVKIALGAAVVATVLTATSDFAPTIAATLAATIAVTALLSGGTATADLISRLTGGTP